MKAQLQITMLVAAALFLSWGLALFVAPVTVHRLISNGAYDPVSVGMLAAAFLGVMVTLVIGARDPAKEVVRAAAAIMALIGFTAAYFIFGAKSMPLSVLTVGSLAIDLFAAGVLFLTEARMDLLKHSAKPAKAVKPSKPKNVTPLRRRRA